MSPNDNTFLLCYVIISEQTFMLNMTSNFISSSSQAEQNNSLKSMCCNSTIIHVKTLILFCLPTTKHIHSALIYSICKIM
ncbi:hypothetical protein GDO81_013425 [Engystomops pustulosus]|uniref:Uncharacterized protein n=1 Tax=Engystomops pustulosus TaxID=76066 RepID=A0AAV7B0E5_ENGPU|nr:hypothetical protein GDO81_013425 [Engystomops pustulosus]